MKKFHLTVTHAACLATQAMLALLSLGASAQTAPGVTTEQRTTAQQVAEKGVPLSELAPDAPEQYTVKSGDTLWAVAGIFLKSPWRWPELWGMNMNDIRNPHRIYPGQQLVLDKSGGQAKLRLKTAQPSPEPGSDILTVKVTPQTRYSGLADSAIPALQNQYIEPFLAEPLIVDKDAFDRAPRIVATQEGRVLLSGGDRAYAKSVYAGQADTPRLVIAPNKSRNWRVFRNATPLKDPVTREVLGYEAQFVGQAYLARSEGVEPATIDILAAKEEMRTGDRLVSESERGFNSYVPRAPETKVQSQIVSVYGSAVTFAAQNQVVVLNKGSQDGLQSGHVLAILKNQVVIEDKTDPKAPDMTLPTERNGLLMVFRTFDRLSYALVLDITDGVKVGDQVVSPK